jgi:5'-nucleotidase
MNCCFAITRCLSRSAFILKVVIATALLPLLAACAGPAPDLRAAVEVKLLAFNDFHGYLTPPFMGVPRPAPDPAGEKTLIPAGGIEHLATLVTTLQAKNPRTALVSAGDLVGASPLISGAFDDEPTVEAMNRIGLDFNGVGNHEFDRGAAALQRLQNGGCAEGGCKSGAAFEGARFRFLAANVVMRGTGKPFLPAYGIKTFGDIRIAFVGVTLRGTMALVPPAGIAGLEFIDEADAVNRVVPELKAQGIETIVVLIHQGGAQRGGDYNSCQEFAGPVADIVRRLDPAVDVVVSGHTHQSYICELYGKLVTSAGSYGRLLTEIDLSIDPQTRDVKAARAVNHVVATGLPKDPAMTEIVSRHAALVASIEGRVVGRISGPISPLADANGESELGKLIADAQLEATTATGAVVAFMNPGGVRAPLPYKEGGAITYGELFAVHPFGNTLVTMTLTGEQILQILEEQWQRDRPRPLYVSRGFSYEWNGNAQPGSRVVPGSVKLNGQPLDRAARYRVAANNFIADGGGGFPGFAQGEQRVVGITDIEAMISYLRTHDSISRDTGPRVRRIE